MNNSHSKLQSHEFLRTDPKLQLDQISARADAAYNQFVETNQFKNLYIHMSNHRVFDPPIYVGQDLGIGRKPKNSFWCGVGTDWIEWCASEKPEWIGNYIYSVELSKSKDIEYINNLEDALWFTKHFKRKTQEIELDIDNIDWTKAARSYDGMVVLNPREYSWDRKELSWLESWDVDTLVLWNTEPGSVRLTLLYYYNPTTKQYVTYDKTRKTPIY